MRRFEFTDGTSNKFWEIEVGGAAFTVHYGRIGASGKTQTKEFADESTAGAEADKLIREKLGKGYVEVAVGGGGELAHAPASPARPSMPTGPMSEEVFWALIGLFNWKKTGDDDAVLRPAVTALARMSVEDIFAFDDILAAKLYALDTREICRGTYRGEIDPDDGDQYVSPDDFLYSRCVIVANGKECFEAAIALPLEVPQGLEFEALLYVASAAYEKKVGKDYDHVTPLSWESFSNEEGWKPTAQTKTGQFTGAGVPPGNRRPT
jgi:predicted DNA-binding WGR domain protein